MRAQEEHRASDRLWTAVVWVELEDVAAELETAGKAARIAMRRIRHMQIQYRGFGVSLILRQKN